MVESAVDFTVCCTLQIQLNLGCFYLLNVSPNAKHAKQIRMR